MDAKRTTQLGTPWAATWDDAWAARVDERERTIGRRICGAKTLADTPCTLHTDHPTGRCPFHGGTDAIGAPIGNSNARIHGLYARRLQRCGTHCAMWQHCPYATDEVLKLDAKERPNCAYETAEYEAVLEEFEHSEAGGPSSVLADSEDDERPRWNLALPDDERDFAEGGPDFSLRTFSFSKEKVRHNLALLQVMVSRAAAALSVTAFTDDVTSESDRYQLRTTKVHAALEAFLRLSREHRAALAQIARDQERERKVQAETNNNGHVPSLADLATPLLERADGVLEEAIQAEKESVNYTRRLERVLEQQFGDQWPEQFGLTQHEVAIQSCKAVATDPPEDAQPP